MRYLWIARHAEATPDESELTEAGRRQATLLGERLAAQRFDTISYSPQARAVETADLVKPFLGHAFGYVSPDLDDRIPTDEPEASAAMIARYCNPAPVEMHDLVITHNFQVAWFVRDALEAPESRWQGLNQCNAGLTVIRYYPAEKPRILLFNDVSHLPPELRWTGFPAELTV